MKSSRARARLARALMTIVVASGLWSALAAAQTPAKGRVVVDSLWSYALGTVKKVVVYLPPGYESGTTRYPVAYYLHGLSGNERNWWKAGRIDSAADSLAARGTPPMIIVMPDGDDSWWMTANALPDVPACRRTLPAYAGDADTFCVPWPHYDDYIAYDLVRWVDRTFRTQADRQHRGIAGLSMGGYGAMMLALQYPQLFGAAASHSGVVWPLEWAPDGVGQRPAGTPDSLWQRVRTGGVGLSMRAAFGADTIAWYSRDPARLFDRARTRGATLPALRADCGVSDPFIAGNRAFRDAMVARGATLEYVEHPGAHDWKYWSGHVGESLGWLAATLR